MEGETSSHTPGQRLPELYRSPSQAAAGEGGLRAGEAVLTALLSTSAQAG